MKIRFQEIENEMILIKYPLKYTFTIIQDTLTTLLDWNRRKLKMNKKPESERPRLNAMESRGGGGEVDKEGRLRGGFSSREKIEGRKR